MEVLDHAAVDRDDPLALGERLVEGGDDHLGLLDGVYNDIKDPDGFLAECRQGAEHGFDGKTLIHPSQVEPANDVWAPTPDAIEEAQVIIAAFDAALAEGKGVVTVNGRMIENLHVDNARRTLAQAEAIAALQAD